MVEHTHDHSQIIYFLHGYGDFVYDHDVYKFEPGELIWIGPKTKHSFTAHPQFDVKTLDIKFEIQSPELLEMVEHLQPLHKDPSLSIMAVMEQIMKEGTKKRPFFRELACLHLVHLLYLLCRGDRETEDVGTALPGLPESKEQTSPAADSAYQFIAEHYMEDLNVDLISREVGYSVNYVSQMFRKTYLCTISDFIKKCRIEKSKELITYSEYNLKQIAELVGFKSVHHFSRVFKQQEGISPGQWHSLEKRGIRKSLLF